MATTEPEEYRTWRLRTRARAGNGQVLQTDVNYTEDMLLCSGRLTHQQIRAQLELQALQTVHSFAKNQNLVLGDISLVWKEVSLKKVIRVQ